MTMNQARRHYLEALLAKTMKNGYGTVSVRVADAHDLGIPVDRTRLDTEWALLPTEVVIRALALAQDPQRAAKRRPWAIIDTEDGPVSLYSQKDDE